MNASRPTVPAALRRRVGLATAGLAAVTAAGCAHVTTVPRDGTLRVALTEYRVIPQDVHTTAGVLTLVVHNYGRLTHDLVISLAGQAEVSSGSIAPGQTAVFDAGLLAGDYVIASSIDSDSALGAYGTLDVGR
ncbi:MAG: hypothetical protein ACRDL5_11825 [Solirubrobacteraceae bacterium]